MPGFFDIFFKQPEPEPEAPKPKKAKKEKKAKKAEKESDSPLDSIRSDIAEIKDSLLVARPSMRGDPNDRKISKPEPESPTKPKVRVKRKEGEE